MKNTKTRVPKSVLVEMLNTLELNLERVTFMERRMWRVTGKGKVQHFSSLHAIFVKYKRAATKDIQMKIDPYVAKINQALY